MAEHVERLVNAILLSALHKRASRIVIASEHVAFEVGGALHEEMRPPAMLHDALIERVATMADLPACGPGQRAVGQIMLRIGGTREVTFATEVSGHAEAARAELRLLS